MNKASDSSKGLEVRLTEPIPDVALVIVHINDHYGSFDCCREPVNRLIEARVASHVYEHSAWNESFLKRVLGIRWSLQSGERYYNFTIKGIHYHVVDNETAPGNYHIDDMQGRRLIAVGGAAGDYCLGRATQEAFIQLYSNLRTDKVREVHIPTDCVYETRGFGNDEDELSSAIMQDKDKVLSYAKKLAHARRSYILSLDGNVVQMDYSIEEPTLHLAVWSRSADMVHYLRHNDRLTLRKVA